MTLWNAPTGRLGSILISPFSLFIFSVPFCSDFIVRHVYFVALLSIMIDPDPSLCGIRLSTLTYRNYREFDPGRYAASAIGIPGLSYRDKLVLGSAFGCTQSPGLGPGIRAKESIEYYDELLSYHQTARSINGRIYLHI